MKKPFYLLALALMSTLVNAQPVPERKVAPRDQQARIREERKQPLSEQLNLSESQREQLKKEQEKALEKVLTPDQKKQLKELKEQQTARKDSAKKRQATRLKEALSLSDEQVVKLQAQQEKFQQSMRSLKKKADAFRDSHRAELKSLMEEQKNNLSQLLNPEQLEKYKRMMRERMQEFRGKIEERPRGPQDRKGPPPPSHPRKTKPEMNEL